MGPQADFYTSVNHFVNTQEWLTGILSTATSGLFIWVASHLWHAEGRLAWRVTNDVPLNQGDAGTSGHAGHPSQHVWDVNYQFPGRQPHPGQRPASSPYPVKNGSLVFFELRNNWWRQIRSKDFALDSNGKADLWAEFPGRTFVSYKVRSERKRERADDYREIVDDYQRTVETDAQDLSQPGQAKEIQLSPPSFSRRKSVFAPRMKITLVFLLDQADASSKPGEPSIYGTMKNGRVVRHGAPPALARAIGIVAAVLVVIAGLLTAGAAIEAGLNQGVIAPTATCGEGTLTIEGSTAFAPILTLVATEYEQQCHRAQITVTGNGSGQGLSDLEFGKSPPDIAMFDGNPEERLRRGITLRAVGDIVMAVVGNSQAGSLPGSVFQQGQGLTHNAITQAFVQGGSGIPGLSGYDVKTVGRPRNSGTREAFIDLVAGGDNLANGTVPTEDTTMDLLGYLDSTPGAIGYAEADALPFFPYVRAIPIDGVLPTRANALNDTYHFLATEHLYTSGPPTGLAADLISFLTSSAEVAQLRDTSYIGCPDLAGTALSADCTDN